LPDFADRKEEKNKKTRDKKRQSPVPQSTAKIQQTWKKRQKKPNASKYRERGPAKSLRQNTKKHPASVHKDSHRLHFTSIDANTISTWRVSLAFAEI
jgi:hypothetical protein